MASNKKTIFRLSRCTAPAIVASAFLLAVNAAPGAAEQARDKQLRDALSAFDGDWTGEVIIWNADGAVVRTVPARRHHRWVGDVQIAVTAFDLGSDTISVRMRRWIEDGRLKAVVYWPVSPSETYRGQITGDGIAWLNEATGYRSLADRIVLQDGVRKMEATSVETTLLTTDSEQVGIDAVFERMQSLQEEPSPVGNIALDGPSVESTPGLPRKPEQTAPSVTVGESAFPAVASNENEIALPEPAPSVAEAPIPAQPEAVAPTGSVYLSSDPPYASFTVEPVEPEGIEPRMGTTPVLVEGLPAGKYTATFHRSGWPNQTSEIEIVADHATSLFHRFESGSVEISSEPAGARILAQGRLVGLTPFTVRNVAPGEIAYVISRAGFRSAEVRGLAQANRSLALRASLEPDGSVVEVNDLEVRPVATRQVSPDVRRNTVPPGSRAVVELTVDRRGRAQDVHLVSTTDERFGQLCLRAAARWRFEPGRVGDVAVHSRVQIPFVAN